LSKYEEHAWREFRIAGWMNDKHEFEDEMQELLCKQIIELLKIFSTHGHSGSSAPYAIELFRELASWEILTPLTGGDSEWNNTIDPAIYQNIRCSHVFKQVDRFDGQAYDSRGIIFRNPDGACFQNSDSCVPIVFPYMPKIEYKDRP